MQNFINIQQFSKTEFETLLTKTENFRTQNPTHNTLLQHKFIANIFFEPSTRTSCSFAISAQKLGANIINLNIKHSATKKGETELDTILTLQAMGVEAFVVRHKDDAMVAKIAEDLNGSSAVINAGSGTQQHPSQALLDMLTIQQHKHDFKHLTVAIIGDMFHSRVAHSDIAALQLLDAKEIRLIAPDSLLPEKIATKNIKTFTDLNTGLQDVDVIITLRMQHERAVEGKMPNSNTFQQQYGLTMEHLQLAKPDAIVMHPGPMNRGIEITDEVIASKQSVIWQQVTNGVMTRMAILARAFDV